MDAQSVIAVDTAVLPWEERFNEKLGRALYPTVLPPRPAVALVGQQ